jgi:queuine/archaeosine tRNA-ribosyltransferase
VTNMPSEVVPKVGPVVWLGQSVDTSSICAGHPDLNSVPFLTSLGCAIRRPALRKTHLNSQLKTKLGIKGPVMVDSGGFALTLNPSARWTVCHVEAAISEIGGDIFVTLDYPPRYDDSRHDRMRKIERGVKNFRVLTEVFPDKIIMPVIHGRSIKEIERSIERVGRVTSRPQWVGLGGMVPLLRRQRALDEWPNSAEAFIAHALSLIRASFEGTMIHVFGAGGTRTFPAVCALGADSGDSIGWRHAAGFGSIFLPLKSQRVITWDRSEKAPRKELDKDDLDYIQSCQCPICGTRRKVDQRLRLLKSSFYNRSIHNAWTLVNQFEAWPRTKEGLLSFIAEGKLGADWADALRHVR